MLKKSLLFVLGLTIAASAAFASAPQGQGRCDDDHGDTCTDPIVVCSLPFAVSGDYPGAFTDTFQGQSSPDIFYEFTIDENSDVVVSLCGSSFDTYLHVMSSDCSLIASNDDSCGLQSEITLSCVDAGTYIAVVEAYSSSATGEYELSITSEECDTPPDCGMEGDNATNPFVVPELPYYTENSSCEFCDDFANSSSDVYYQFTLDNHSDVIISLCGSEYDTYLWLLDSDGTTVIDANDDACGMQSELMVEGLEAGTYYALVEGFGDHCGNFMLYIDAISTTLVEPVEFSLSQNYPNPFNPTTTIEFGIAEPGQVSLNVYNVNGERVSQLVNGDMAVGHHTVEFDASHLTSGMYVYTLRSAGKVKSEKMLLVK